VPAARGPNIVLGQPGCRGGAGSWGRGELLSGEFSAGLGGSPTGGGPRMNPAWLELDKAEFFPLKGNIPI